MATYDSTSAYYTTGYSQFYLDTMTNRAIPKESDDRLMQINQTYQRSPCTQAARQDHRRSKTRHYPYPHL